MASTLKVTRNCTLASSFVLLAAFCVHWQRGSPGELQPITTDDFASPGLELLQKHATVFRAKIVKGAEANDTRGPGNAKPILKDFKVTTNGPGNLIVFITGMFTDLAIMTLCLILFRFGNRWYKVMYRDNVIQGYTKDFTGAPLGNWSKDPNEDDGPLNREQTSWFGWARASWALKTHHVWEVAGLDHAMMIHFTDISLYAMGLIAVMLLITGLLNLFFGGNAAGDDYESWLSLGNVKFYSPLYWVTGFVTWYVAGVICWMCHNGMKDFMKLRRRWLKSWDNKRARTLLMLGIPLQYRTDKKCRMFWDKLFPGRIEHVSVTKDTTGNYGVLAWWSARNNAETKLKRLRATGAEQSRIDRCIQDHSEKERQLKEARKALQVAIDKDEGKDLNAPGATIEAFCQTGFIAFRRREDAEIALRLDLSDDVNEWVLDYAPMPTDIIWGDMTQDPTADSGRMLVGYALTLLIMILYMPMVVAICNVAEMIHMGPFQPIWSAEAPSLGLTIMVDFLPTILNLIFTNFFSLYDKTLSQYKIAVWYWWMNVLYVVLITALGTDFLSFVRTMAHDPTRIFALLANTLPSCTHYYMDYLAMQWYAHTMVLTRYFYLFKFWCFGEMYSEKEAKELAEPEDQDYYGMGSRSARWSVTMCIGIVYGTISPPCAVLCWCTMFVIRVIYGYMFTFAETRKSDMGGIFFVRSLHNMFISLHIYFVVMIGVLLQRGPRIAFVNPALIAACAWVYVFYQQKKFSNYKWERLPFPSLKELDEEEVELERKPKSISTLGDFAQPELQVDSSK